MSLHQPGRVRAALPATSAAGKRVEMFDAPQTRACLSAFRADLPTASAAGKRVETLRNAPTRLPGSLTPAGCRRHTKRNTAATAFASGERDGKAAQLWLPRTSIVPLTWESTMTIRSNAIAVCGGAYD